MYRPARLPLRGPPPSGALNPERSLPAAHASDGERLQAGRIYVARPDFHLLLDSHFIRVVRGPRENVHRPAIDPLFRSAATAYGPRVIGVILTGALDDGSLGLQAVVRYGGIGIVQEPDDADASDMPRNALNAANPQHCVPLLDVAGLITRLVHTPPPPDVVPPPDEMSEPAVMTLAEQAIESLDRRGAPSPFTCPECHGTLWEMDDGEGLRYRCRVGQAYSEATMAEAHARAVERSLWVAVRSLQENASLSRRIASRAATRHQPAIASRFEQRAEEMEENAREIQRALLDLRGTDGVEPDEDQ